MHPISQISVHTAALASNPEWLGMPDYQDYPRVINAARSVGGFHVAHTTDSLRQRRRLPVGAHDPMQPTTPTFVPDQVRIIDLYASLPGQTWPIAIPPRLMSPVNASRLAILLAQRESRQRIAQRRNQRPMPEPTDLKLQHPSVEEGTRTRAEKTAYARVATEADSLSVSLLTTLLPAARYSIMFPLGNPFWMLLNRNRPPRTQGREQTTEQTSEQTSEQTREETTVQTRGTTRT